MSGDPDLPPDGRRLPRRATDRVEDVVAWFLMVVGLVFIVVAWSAGVAVYHGSVDSASTMTQTRAVLLADAEVVAFSESGVRPPVHAEARWVDRAGVERTGEIRAEGSARAGTQVDVWVGPDGEATTRSLGRENAATAGIVTAAGLMLAGGAVLAGGWYGVRCLTAACNARRWEREWARVGPDWSSRPL